MKSFITEYGMTIFYALIAMIILAVEFQFHKMVSFDSFYPNGIYGTKLGDNEEFSFVEKPMLEIQKLVILDVDETYHPTKYIIKAVSPEGDDIRDCVTVYYIDRQDSKGLNMSVLGSRRVRYKLTYNGVSTIVEQIVVVKNKGVIG